MREVGDVIYESNKLVLSLFSLVVPCSGLRVHQKSGKSLVEMKEAFGTGGKAEGTRVVKLPTKKIILCQRFS